jgi:hypothetical protein
MEVRENPEYQKIQRKLEKDARRVFFVDPKEIQAGQPFTSIDGRAEYVISPDGSWRRRDKKRCR